MMRCRRLFATLAIATAVAGCGGTAARPRAHVRLRLSAPADGIRTSEATVTVTGNVSPTSARVLVLGAPVSVRGGSFSARVPLAPGANLIDVLAGQAHAYAAMAAVRVTRFELITVPAVSGDGPSAATARLQQAGLAARLVPSSAPLEFLFPLPTRVCSTSPAAGAKVDPGSTVNLDLGKFC